MVQVNIHVFLGFYAFIVFFAIILNPTQGHPTLFINRVCSILVNSFVIPGCIMNGACLAAWAYAFSCFRACDSIMCSPGVHLVPFFSLDINGASLNSGLLMEHVCCHMFLPAHVFPSGLGNIPVTEIGVLPFPHRGAILDVGRCPGSSVVWDPTALMMMPALLASAHQLVLMYQPHQGRSPHNWRKGGKAWPFFLFQLDLPDVASDSESKGLNRSPQFIGVLLSCFCRTASSPWRLVSLASSSVILELACTKFSSAFQRWSLSAEAFSSVDLMSLVRLLW